MSLKQLFFIRCRHEIYVMLCYVITFWGFPFSSTVMWSEGWRGSVEIDKQILSESV